MQGDKIIQQPLDILLISVPLIIFFLLMFAISFVTSWLLKFKYKDTVTIAFTSSSNNFELAIAVAVGVFGITSQQALATTVGPLIEVLILLTLVYLARWLQKKMFKNDTLLLEKSQQEREQSNTENE